MHKDRDGRFFEERRGQRRREKLLDASAVVGTRAGGEHNLTGRKEFLERDRSEPVADRRDNDRRGRLTQRRCHAEHSGAGHTGERFREHGEPIALLHDQIRRGGCVPIELFAQVGLAREPAHLADDLADLVGRKPKIATENFCGLVGCRQFEFTDLGPERLLDLRERGAQIASCDSRSGGPLFECRPCLLHRGWAADGERRPQFVERL